MSRARHRHHRWCRSRPSRCRAPCLRREGGAGGASREIGGAGGGANVELSGCSAYEVDSRMAARTRRRFTRPGLAPLAGGVLELQARGPGSSPGSALCSSWTLAAGRWPPASPQPTATRRVERLQRRRSTPPAAVRSDGGGGHGESCCSILADLTSGFGRCLSASYRWRVRRDERGARRVGRDLRNGAAAAGPARPLHPGRLAALAASTSICR